MVERTDDGRHVVVDGRRWRAADPALAPDVAQALVGELMAARRAVGAARGDDAAVAAARARVQDAKVALGERGRAWWEPLEDDAVRERMVAARRALERREDAPVVTADLLATLGGRGEPAAWRDLATAVVEDGG